jgi:branched-subunit amino acid transport protein
MSGAWTVVVVVGACTIVFKAMGPVILGGRELPRRIRGVVALLAPTLLAALVVVSTFGSGQELAIDARAAGMVAAAAAVALRAPVIVVVTTAAVVAALTRLIT